MSKPTFQKIMTAALFLLSFTFVLMSFTNTFDYDFGWHLRFGQDWWGSGSFPYLDSYTYTFAHKPWVNHEWGTGWVYWLIYNNLGYFAIQLLLTIPTVAGFIITLKAFRVRIGPAAGLATFLCIYAVQPVLVSRPAMLLPFFLAVLFYLLENIRVKKHFYFLPILFWIWSMLHGSWILGFIVIDIYIAGNIINSLAKKYFPRFAFDNGWTWREYKTVLIWSSLAALIILANPYGWHIWKEVIIYFSHSYYKAAITEWVPSYTYPIFWKSLLLMGATIPLAGLGIKNKKITWPQTLIYLAFWYAAFIYKRHMLMIALASLPIVAMVISDIHKKIMQTKKISEILQTGIVKKSLQLICVITIILLETIFLINTRYTKNIWQEGKLLTESREPWAAAEFLKNKIGDSGADVYNYFSWGGFLEWAVPRARLYLDGRGTVSWMYNKDITMLEHYQNISYGAGGIQEIEASSAKYVIWQNNAKYEEKPDFVNKIIFSNIDSYLQAATQPIHLEKMLDRSGRWERIYEDNLAIIWQRK